MDDSSDIDLTPKELIARRETDRLESVVIQWLFVAFLFFVVKTVTWRARILSLIASSIAIYLLIVIVIYYLVERGNLQKRGIQPALRTDLLILGVIGAIGLSLWVLYRLIVTQFLGQE